MKAIRLIVLFGVALFATSFNYQSSTTGYKTHVERDDHLTLGNPTNATSDKTKRFNYLMTKTGYTLSYNDTLGYPNWVSWHVNTEWLGDKDRCDCFAGDNTLPVNFTKITQDDYEYGKNGFDRGHLCPSADRTESVQENAETFLMTNMCPQTPNLNRKTWVDLEKYTRVLITGTGGTKNECFVIAGGYGMGGEGKKDKPVNKIAGGKINVPAFCWKILVVLPEGTGDINRITNDTRVIAVWMPNKVNVNTKKWGDYRVTVDEIEKQTGYDFLSNLPTNIQTALEAKVDTGPTK